MKKSILALMALAGMASAASDLIYWGGANNYDLLTISGGYTPYLAENSHRAPGSVVTALTTENDTTYNLVFNPSQDSNVVTPSFALNNALYLNQLTVAGDTLPSSFTIDFGTAGSITTARELNFGQSVTSFTLSASMTEDQLSALADGNVVTRTLMSGKGNYGIWNFGNRGTKNFTINNLEGYDYVGAVASAEALQAGQFGYIYTDTASADSVTLVVKGLSTPEPTTATLSLLALAGLAARRRR